MSNTKIILYDCLDIYKILHEISDITNFELENAKNENDLNNIIKNYNTFIIIGKKKTNFPNQIILSNLPIKLNDLIEKINLEILKINYSQKSNINIGKYIINLNSREISLNDKSIKLTEQEIKLLVYLLKSNDKIKVEKLQKEIWKYNSNLETHTVETHIHRLRKKMYENFDDNEFIISNKNGYKIN